VPDGGNNIEYLHCGFAGELKFAEGDTVARKFGGMGAVFNNIDSYGDKIEPGAFASWLADVKAGKQEWPAMLSQHGAWGMTSEDLTPVGAWLDLYEDGKGLGVDGELADTERGRDLYTLMKMKPRPAIKGLSIGYLARKFTLGTKPGEPRRTLHQIDVVEISPVTFPANAKAKVSAVKAIEQMGSMREVEDFLCMGGMSKTQAMALIARIKGIGPGDPADANGGPGDPAAVAALIASARKRGESLAR
jgi:HK97 family phage prohead protease